MAKNWGRIVMGTRLEKQVEAEFLPVWSLLVTKGLRSGDGWMIETGKVAHKAANALVRRFLQTQADTLFMLDSDANIGSSFLHEFRDYEAGWDYDALQAFYVRRGWPPEAIWFKRKGTEYMRCMVLQEDAVDDVALVGTHCALFRREIFERMLAERPDVPVEDFDWFHYPRHNRNLEDTALSMEAEQLGFRLGATTHVKAGHISRMTTGWETYMDYLDMSGQREQLEQMREMQQLVCKALGLGWAEVDAQLAGHTEGVREAWNRAKPVTAGEVRGFYGSKDSGYLVDLLWWNMSEMYMRMMQELRQAHGMNVLVVGGGLGSEAAAMAKRNNVDVFELPGALREFCRERFNHAPCETVNSLEAQDRTRVTALTKVVALTSGFEDSVRVLEDATLARTPIKRYDMIVAIDVLEHIHPDEFESTLDAILARLAKTGRLYIHTTWDLQETYPMHYNHSERFVVWCVRRGVERVGETAAGAEIYEVRK
jgi:hypothetical protein